MTRVKSYWINSLLTTLQLKGTVRPKKINTHPQAIQYEDELVYLSQQILRHLV